MRSAYVRAYACSPKNGTIDRAHIRAKLSLPSTFISKPVIQITRGTGWDPAEFELLTVHVRHESLLSVLEVPSIGRLLEPALVALAQHEGTCTNDEMHALVVDALGLSLEQVREPHGATSRTEIEYRLAWARTRLRQEGLIELVEKKRWRLTDRGWDRASSLTRALEPPDPNEGVGL